MTLDSSTAFKVVDIPLKCTSIIFAQSLLFLPGTNDSSLLVIGQYGTGHYGTGQYGTWTLWYHINLAHSREALSSGSLFEHRPRASPIHWKTRSSPIPLHRPRATRNLPLTTSQFSTTTWRLTWRGFNPANPNARNESWR
ncbi:hypothetical protein L596_029028 [Steinernema carpocapsae]|uniref:Uncharacterized protein n=1 Tax=Steinernema carpocapsae TaxID=34508 RepID=A0A4U5LTE4_STECR|nr:hypothetical protein L596_029028 [Steinernema carpocapsae]